MDLYREAGRIEDALRVAKEYAPAMVEEVQRIYVEQGPGHTAQAPTISAAPRSAQGKFLLNCIMAHLHTPLFKQKFVFFFKYRFCLNFANRIRIL